MTALPHFTESELACPLTGEIRLADGFGEALEALRVAFDKPMPLSSACRSQAHNAALPGHPHSLHMIDNPHWATGGCCAVDVAISNTQMRALLVQKALEKQWSVGVASNFIHLDLRGRYLGLPQVLFHYKR
jgi:hypothetical protein